MNHRSPGRPDRAMLEKKAMTLNRFRADVDVHRSWKRGFGGKCAAKPNGVCSTTEFRGKPKAHLRRSPASVGLFKYRLTSAAVTTIGVPRSGSVLFRWNTGQSLHRILPGHHRAETGCQEADHRPGEQPDQNAHPKHGHPPPAVETGSAGKTF